MNPKILPIPMLIAGMAVAALLAGCHSRSAQPTVSHAESGSARLISYAGGSGIQMDADSLRLAGVSTFVVGVKDLHTVMQPTGEIEPTDSDTVQVTARLPGKIAQALVSVGSHVQKGQVIATVDSVDLTQAEAAYQTALAHQRLTYNQLQQQRRLAGYGVLSEQPVEDARRALAAAQAAVSSDQAQIKLDRLTLANTGQLVQMGEITRKPVEDAQNAYAQAQSALRQARVTLNSTHANLDRAKILYNGGVFSKQQLEDATTANDTAVAAADQATTQETLAAEELKRQQSIYQQNLNGTSSLQTAQSKLQQDEHTYQNDLVALALNRKELARAQVVHKSGIPVSQALQQAEDAYAEAQVALQGTETTLRLYGISPGTGAAQLQNGHVVIPVVAPISGIVTTRNMVVGQITDITTPLVKIVNLDRVYVDAQVYEKDLGGVAPGDPVRLNVAAFPGRFFTGHVAYVADEVSPDTRTITVRTIIQNPGWLLRPGMFATVDIGSRTGERTLAIPADAILQEGTRQVVYVQVAPGQFVKRTVTVGEPVNGMAPVRSGIKPAERIVVSGNVLLENEQQKLEDERQGAA